MGFFDDALKGAVPGGNLATPIAIAAGALLLGKLFGGSSAAPTPAPQQSAAPAGGGLLGGLSDLVQKFQNSGHGDAVNSWVGPGANARSSRPKSARRSASRRSAISPVSPD